MEIGVGMGVGVGDGVGMGVGVGVEVGSSVGVEMGSWAGMGVEAVASETGASVEGEASLHPARRSSPATVMLSVRQNRKAPLRYGLAACRESVA